MLAGNGVRIELASSPGSDSNREGGSAGEDPLSINGIGPIASGSGSVAGGGGAGGAAGIPDSVAVTGPPVTRAISSLTAVFSLFAIDRTFATFDLCTLGPFAELRTRSVFASEMLSTHEPFPSAVA
jgi:hypothetical protein